MGLSIFRALAGAFVLALGAPVIAMAAEACPTVEVAPVVAGAPIREIRDAQNNPVALGAPLASLADITSASANAEDGVNFNVRPAAGARLRAYTSANIGKPIAIVIDGRPRMVTIRAALTGDTFRLNPIDLFEGRMLAARVNDCVTR